MRQQLRQVFGQKFTPGAIHRFLPRLDRPQLLVTTNYDDLITAAHAQVVEILRQRDITEAMVTSTAGVTRAETDLTLALLFEALQQRRLVAAAKKGIDLCELPTVHRADSNAGAGEKA